MEEATTTDSPVTESSGSKARRWIEDRRLIGFIGYVAVLSLVFLLPLIALVRLSLKEELVSHVLLIPFVSIYLAGIQRHALPRERRSSPMGAALFALAAVAVYFVPGLGMDSGHWSHNDRLAQWTTCHVLLVVSGGFAILGSSWMRVLAFPFAFLIFMIPMPDLMVYELESFLMRYSAVLSEVFFQWSGTPVHRAGQVLQLPGMTLEVASECSGIRSSVVLFITSLLASYMFLRSSWHRVWLVALVIPLGIIRNSIRVLVIGLMCVHMGPEMIDSWVHHRGGPMFFAASLVPLFLVAAWFRHREARHQQLKNESDSTPSKMHD